jgi:tRNA threonylcarbamoyladenosine biosynthesis protein TsaE
MAAGALSLFLPDEAATDRLGQAMAQILKPGDLLCLEGELGAGKTALARAIVRAMMGDPSLDVPSPSFALVQPYTHRARTVLHADLYRLNDPREIEELGLFDDPEAVVLVEWPERVPELAPRAALTIRLAIGAGGKGRNAVIAAGHIESLAGLAGTPA